MYSANDIQRIGALPSAERQKLPLAPGDDAPESQWRHLVNARAEVDGQYVFWKTRGGSTLVNSFFGNVLTVYPMQGILNGVATEYLAVHTAGGKVFLWDIAGESSDEIVSSGFSTTSPIQFANIGRFLYMFDYDGGNSQYYDLNEASTNAFLSYDKAYFSALNKQKSDIQDTDSILGFEKGAQILVFPNEPTDEGAEVISSADGAGVLDPKEYLVNSFRYVYNGGEHLIDADGREYKSTQFFTFAPDDNPINFTVGGGGANFTIESIYIPLDENGAPDFTSYVTKADRVYDSSNGSYVYFKDRAGVARTVQIGGTFSGTAELDARVTVFPYNDDLEPLVGLPSSKIISNSGDEVVSNSAYERPQIWRQYVVFDMLGDGSVTIPGRPFEVSLGPSDILETGASSLTFTVTSPSDNVEKRFLAATRWQETADKAFDPTSERYPNSPLFIVRELNIDRTIFTDTTPDRRLLSGIGELQPNVAGVCDLFGSDSLSPHSVAQFRGSLMLAGYSVARPTPTPYTNPATATKGNIHIDITATSQLANNMALAFQFQYADGRRSSIVQTEEFLQEGSTVESEPVACDQTKASASHTVTGGATADDTLTVTYDGQTVNVPLTTASHGTPSEVAEAIRAAIAADGAIQLDPANPSGGDLEYTDKRFGEEFNGLTINVDPTTTGVTFDTEDPTTAGAAEPDPLPAKVFLRLKENFLSGADDPADFYVNIDGYGDSDTFSVSPGDTAPAAHAALRDAINNAAALNSDWTASISSETIDGVERDVVLVEAQDSGNESLNGIDVTFQAASGSEIFSVEWGVSAPGLAETDYQGQTAGASAGCLQATASMDVTTNGLAGSTSEDHTLTIDGNSTAAITVADTDTLEAIVDLYVAEIEATPIIHTDWNAEKVDNGDGTWRLLLTYRNYGSVGNGLDISIAGNTDVSVTVNSPSAGGEDAGTVASGSANEVNANRLQIHSLNTLVQKVYVLGRTTDGGTSFHLIDEYDITDPQAHGKYIDLPNTAEALDEIELDTFDEPAAHEILESVELSSWVVVGTPFQQFRISDQENIVDQSKIQRAVPIDFDADKSTMRYRVMIFTDKNIQLGYLVEATEGGFRFFDSDFEILFAGMIATAPKGITELLGRVVWQTADAVYSWVKQGPPERLYDRRRYSVSNNNDLKTVIYNHPHGEFWLIYGADEIVVYDAGQGLTRRMKYSGVGSVRAGAFFGDKLYIGADTDLLQTDIAAQTADADGDTVTATAETVHLGDELAQLRLLELTVGGQAFSMQAEVDLEPERFEDDGGAWSKAFNTDKDLGSKTLDMAGASWQIQHMATRPRIRLTFPAVAGGFVSHAILKYVPTANIGRARQ